MIDIHAYFPHAGFSFPRGYLQKFSVRISGIVAVTNVDNLIIGHYHVGAVETDFYWRIDPGMWLPSTIGYFLNRALTDTFYFNTGTMSYFPLPTNVGVWADDPPGRFGIYVTEPDFAVAAPLSIDFPAMPDDYWSDPH